MFRLFSLLVISYIFLIAQSFASEFKIAVVDIKRIENGADVIKFIKEKITVKQKALQTEVEKERKMAQKKVEDLQKASATISRDALTKKQADLEKELAGIEQKLQDRAKSLQEIQLSAVSKVDDKIHELSASVAKKDGYSIVISNIATLYNSDNIDITEQVLRQLNAELKKVNME